MTLTACDSYKCLGEARCETEAWAGLGTMSRGDPMERQHEEAGAWRGGGGLGQGTVGTRTPGCGARLDAVSCRVALWILGHGVGITEELSLVRVFWTERWRGERD